MLNIIERLRIKTPPDKDWRLQRQTDPPTFGWAKLADLETLDREVMRRRDECERIIDNSPLYCAISENKISLIILSCRRWDILKRLINSLKRYFAGVEDYPHMEKILVDNGSGFGLIENAMNEGFFDKIIAHPGNIGMVGALKDAYRRAEGEYILFVEDDFILDCGKPFIKLSTDIFKNYPEIGIIRLKDQNNWWKPYRIIAPLRKTHSASFWTWLPSKNSMLNGWTAGSVIFRKVSYFSTGELPDIKENLPRTEKFHQGYIYECVYGKAFNKKWLAAKMKGCYPFIQPNLNEESSGWGE